MFLYVFLPFIFGFSINRPFIGNQRNFRVDNNMFVIRQIDHNIRLNTFIVISYVTKLLLIALFPFIQPRTFENPFQDHFAPVPLFFHITF